MFVGAVGIDENLELLAKWLDRCTQTIPAKEGNKQPNLFLPFNGFNPNSGFRCEMVFDDSLCRKLTNSDIRKITKSKSSLSDRIDAAVLLYLDHVKFLAMHRNVDVIMCVIPDSLFSKITGKKSLKEEDTLEQEDTDTFENNFRRSLKAKAMAYGKPIQLVRETTLKEGKASKAQQDDATRAWNMCVALYYKSHYTTIPWRIPEDRNTPSTCHIGVGFYWSRDRTEVSTSLAQIFDELGNGVILKGTPVQVEKHNKRPYLNEEQAYQLLSKALAEYKFAVGSMPGRLVLHKTSNYREDEKEGYLAAVGEFGISTVDFVTIMDSNFRLFRKGQYPVHRGSRVSIDEQREILFTRGAVEFYRTYPGMYIPKPIEIRLAETDSSAERICKEILSLTKMNWNNTQFDRKYPITLACAHNVGEIMKYLPENQTPQINYSFYM